MKFLFLLLLPLFSFAYTAIEYEKAKIEYTDIEGKEFVIIRYGDEWRSEKYTYDDAIKNIENVVSQVK